METNFTKMLNKINQQTQSRLVQDKASSLTSKTIFTTNLWQEVVMAESCRDFGVSYQKEGVESSKTFWTLKGHPVNLNSALNIYFENMKQGRPERVTDKELEAAKQTLFPLENTRINPSIDTNSIEKYKGEMRGNFTTLWVARDQNNQLYSTSNLEYKQAGKNISVDIKATNWKAITNERYSQIQDELYRISPDSKTRGFQRNSKSNGISM
jgi:hypothetical protein